MLWYFVGAVAIDKYLFPRSVAELCEHVNRISKMIKYTLEYDDIVEFYSIIKKLLGAVALEGHSLNVRIFD